MVWFGYLALRPSDKLIPPIIKPSPEDVVVTVGKTEYQKDEVVRISVKNNSAETVFLGGCNQFNLEIKENNQWKTEPPLKMCVWEGYAAKINSNGSADYTLNASKSGMFRINVGYSKGCEEGKPANQADCKSSDIAYSAEFTVVEAKQVTVGEDFLITLPANPFLVI